MVYLNASSLGAWTLVSCQAGVAEVTSPQYNPWAPSLSRGPLGDTILHVLSTQLTPGRVECVLCAYVPFLFASFPLYPFAVINLGLKHYCMLSRVSPTELPNLGVVLGTPCYHFVGWL